MAVQDVDRPERGQTGEMGWASDVVAQLLRRSGIPFITLNPGASFRGLHDSLVNHLGNRDPQMLLCLNEDHVVSIAHGYAKATDRPLACVLHSNVGLMHGLMGIFNAWADRVPMLVLGATGPIRPERRRPWIDWIHTTKDQGALLRNYVKWDDEPRSVEGLVEGITRALQLTEAAPRAPVYVCLDAGLQEEELGGEVVLPDLARFAPPAPPAGAPQDAADVAARLARAERPVLLFGRGSRAEADWARRVELAELAGAAVVTSLRERAVFPTTHPQHVGAPSGWMSPSARRVIAAADLIVSLDWVDLAGYLQQLGGPAAQLKTPIVHVSLDSLLHNGWSMDHFGLPPADRPVMADPDSFVAALLPALKARLGAGGGAAEPGWAANTPKPPAPGYSAGADAMLTAQDIEVALAELRAVHALTLAHTTIGWGGSNFSFEGPLDYLGHDGASGLGAGPGLTMGAALALRDSGRVVVGVIGDGDFMQGAAALWTAAHYRLPALFVIANNRSNFNDELHQEAVARARGRLPQNRWVGQRIDEPAIDIAGLARAQGVEALGPVEGLAALRQALRQGVEAVRAGRPFLIDVRTRPADANIVVSRRD